MPPPSHGSMFKARTLSLPLFAATLSACFALPRPLPREAERPRAFAEPTIELRESPSRPRVALLSREGDPRAAIALSVVTDEGGAAAVALAAIVERRLEARGLPRPRVAALRDGYRIEALVTDAGEATALVEAIRDALLTPLAEGSEEVAHAKAYLQRLARQQVDPAGEAIAACTGALSLRPDELRPLADANVAALEALRLRTHTTSRVAFSVVAPPPIVEATAAAVARSRAWPSGPPPSSAWPKGDEVEVQTSEASARARVTVALRVGDARDAMWVAERAGEADGPLVARLGGLPAPFRLVDVIATTRPRGGCLAATVELEHATGAGFEDLAAQAARLVEAELREGLAEARALPLFPDPWRRAREMTDPRDAAGLAAFWTLATPVPDEPLRETVLASLPSPKSSRKATEKRFRDALRAEAPPPRSVEHRIRVERGQNRLWLLLGSPCGLLSESSSDAGTTALSLLSAAARGAGRGVILEPWLSADGTGLLAHATRLPGESSEALADRVATEAARALTSTARSSGSFPKARALLLSRLAREDGREGSAFEIAAEALSPSHLSWIAHRGSFDSAARVGVEAVSLRTEAFLQGPLRVAVLADDTEDQGQAAARTIARWLSEAPKQAKHCSRPSSRVAPRPGLIEVELPKGAQGARAIVAFPLPGETPSASVDLLAAALNGEGGLLARALAPSAFATATARPMGGSLVPSLFIDVRAPEDQIDAAVAQLRALFATLADGGPSADDFSRAVREHREATLEALLDPRRRIVDLWLGEGAVPLPDPPSLPTLQSLAASVFQEDRAVIVLARPSSS